VVARRKAPPGAAATEPSERGSLRATAFAIDEQEYLVLSYPVAPIASTSELTHAERDVALAFARGRSMRDIAAMRGTSTRTIANQIRAIYAKLGVGSRVQLCQRLSR
jgi:DNA-binding CsgD family transcriptional regulator